MRMSNFSRFSTLLTPVFALSLAAAAYLGFALISLPYDKLVHFCVFLVLTIEFYYVFDTKNIRRLRLATFFVCTIGASVGLEIVQEMVNPSRVFDPVDIAFNVTGSLLGLIVATTTHHWALVRARRLRLGPQDLEGDELADYVDVGAEDAELEA